jgi:hypothetical protein
MPGTPPNLQFVPRPPESVAFYPSLIPVQNRPPATSALMWCDTSSTPPTLRGWNGSAWVALTAAGSGGGGGPVTYTFSSTGPAVARVGTHRLYNDTGTARTITAVRASVGTAPAGSQLVVDVNVNGVSIWPTHTPQPAINVGEFTDKADALETTTWPSGAYLTVDVDQVGIDTAGSDLTVTVTTT